MPDNKKNEEKESRSSIYKDVGPYLGIGMQLAVTVGVFIFIGVWLDGKYDKSPIFTLILAFAGCAIGLYSFIKTIIELGKRSEK